MEAPTGFEPVNNGFANHCLNHLATAPGFYFNANESIILFVYLTTVSSSSGR